MDQLKIESLLSTLIIRTMKHDLEILLEKEKKEPPLPEVKPLEVKRIEAAKPAKKPKPVSLAAQLLSQAKQAYHQKTYQEAINLSQKILQDKTSPWLVSFQAKSLIKKSRGAQQKLARQRQERFQAELAKQVTPILPSQPKVKLSTYLSKLGQITKILKPKSKPVTQPLTVELPPPPRSLPAEITPLISALAKEASAAPTPSPKPSFLSALSSFLSSAKPRPFSLTTIGSLFKPFLTSGIILGGSIIVLIIVLTYAAGRSPEPPQPPPPEPEPSPPSALFIMERQEVIALAEAQLPQLPEKIQTLAQAPQLAGRFTHLVIKQVNGKIKYPDLSQVLSALKISLPVLQCLEASSCPENPGLIDNLITEQYSLFLYFPKESPSSLLLATTSPAATLGTTTPSDLVAESPPTLPTTARLGIIAKLKDSTRAKQILRQSEAGLSQILEPLLLGEKVISDSSQFKDNLYQQVPIRYLNFPEKFLTLDYAVWQDWLLIATSKESAYQAIDRILTSQ